jgi:ATP-dependent DNA ligase
VLQLSVASKAFPSYTIHPRGKRVPPPIGSGFSFNARWGAGGLAIDRRVARFIEPMECLPVEKIPEGDVWTYELKLDGYRLEAVKRAGKVILYSRRGTDLSRRFKYVTTALASLPDETVIDGEVVALDEHGKPNFNLLQNFRSAESHIMLYAFDVLVRKGDRSKDFLSITAETNSAGRIAGPETHSTARRL